MFVGRDLNYLHATVTSGIDERCSHLPGAPFFRRSVLIYVLYIIPLNKATHVKK